MIFATNLRKESLAPNPPQIPGRPPAKNAQTMKCETLKEGFRTSHPVLRNRGCGPRPGFGIRTRLLAFWYPFCAFWLHFLASGFIFLVSATIFQLLVSIWL